LHLSALSNEDRLAYRCAIHNALISRIKILIEAIQKYLPSQQQERVHRILAAGESLISPSLGADINLLWEDSAVQKAIIKHSNNEIPTYIQYFLGRIERISAVNYVPCNQDILLCPKSSTGVVHTDVHVADVMLRIVDIVGLGEKKKWVHCFEDVISVVFCVALDEYDMCEGYSNKMNLALELFTEVCNETLFQNAGMILLFTKKDVFEEKIQQVDMTMAFPDYKGGKNYQSAVTYIQKQFIDRIPKGKAIYPHVMSALDTNNNVENVLFTAVKDVVLRQILINAKK